jgi:2-dehydro-3-deoxyphosphogluconate aldolase/(4S)-4-hydroxy-2-oxoglutarate aldolase
MADRMTNLKRIAECGIVPVVRATSAEEGRKIADAVVAGGVDIVEITMTVPGAIGVVADLAKHYGDSVLLGAGTVLDSETARAAILAGVEFVVGPNTNFEMMALVKRYGKLVMPGAMTPTEVVAAWEAGADVVKIFPAGEIGGAKYIKSLKGPLPQIEMMPTGGVNLTTAADFIKAGCIALGAGSALVDKKAVAAGKFEVVTENAEKFREIIKEARS